MNSDRSAYQRISIRNAASKSRPSSSLIIAHRRSLVLGSTAIMSTCMFLAAAAMAQAACVVNGTGTVTAPQSGDRVICTGADLVNPIIADTTSRNVTVVIGDGTSVTDLTVTDTDAVAISTNSAVIVNGNATITTAGDSAHGILGAGGGNSVILDGGSIATSGDGAEGIALSGGNADTITINSGSIVTMGHNAVAADAGSNTEGSSAQIQINGGEIRTDGIFSGGLRTLANFATVTVTGGTIETAGDISVAAAAVGLGSKRQSVVTISGGTLMTSGADSDGAIAGILDAADSTATVSVTGGTIITTGDNSPGARATAGSSGIISLDDNSAVVNSQTSVTIGGGSLTTSGANSAGATAVIYNATDSIATVNVTGGTITTTGDNAAGALALVQGANVEGTISVGGTATISTSGDGAHGAFASVAGGSAAINISGGASIVTTGVEAHGAFADATNGSAALDVSGGTISADNGDSSAVKAQSEGNSANASVTISGGTLTANGTNSKAVSVQAVGDGAVSIANVSGGSLEAQGLQAIGVEISSRGTGATATVAVTGGKVSVGREGESATGIMAGALGENAAAKIAIAAGEIVGSGSVSSGVLLETEGHNASGDLEVSGGTIRVSGSGSTAISALSDGTFGGTTNVVSISGGIVSATGTGARAVRLISQDGASSTLIMGSEAIVTGDLFASSSGHGANSLIFNDIGTGEFSDDIAGFNTISKIDSGIWTLSGSITGSGDISVEAGTLIFDGNTDSAVNILSGGTLSGSGTVARADFQSGSIYRVDLSSSEFLTSSEHVTIDNGASLDLVGSTGLSTGSSFTVLTASAIEGTFGTINEDFLFFDATVANLGSTLELTIDRNGASFSDFTKTANQAATASAVESLGASNAIFETVLASESPGDMQDAFDQLSGEVHASLQGGLAAGAGLPRDVIGSRIRSSFGGIVTRTLDQHSTASTGHYMLQEAAPSHDVWGQVYGGFGRTESDGNAAETTRATGGTLFGVETGIGSDWRVGAFAGYGRSGTDVEDRTSSADVDSYTFGAYAGRSAGPLRVQLGSSFSWHEIASTRTIDFGGFTDELDADYNATTAQVFGEVGYAVSAGGLAVEPFAGAALVYQHASDFTETGGAAALTASSSSDTLTVSTIGLRSAYDYGHLAGGTLVTIDGSLGWSHAFGGVNPSTTMAFASGSDAFSVSGTPLDKDMALIETGLTFGFENGMDLSLRYSGTIGSSATAHGINASLKAKF